MAAADGYRYLPALGNAYKRLTSTIRNLAPGDYYWSVQAIDAGLMGGPWATEQVVTVP